MPTKYFADKQTIILTEVELLVLSSIFLALPLPPMMNKGSATDLENLEDLVAQAGDNLLKKGIVSVSDASPSIVDVSDDVSSLLQTVAYSSEMVHLYWQVKGEEACQFAFYRYQDRVSFQEMAMDGLHRFNVGPTDMGFGLVKELLGKMPDGHSETKAQLSLEAWHYLLSARLAGIENEVEDALMKELSQSNDDAMIDTVIFSKAVLEARLVMELTAISDQLKGTQEKISIILTETSNWILNTSASVTEQDQTWAVCVPRDSVLQAVSMLYAPILQKSGNEEV